MPPDPDVSSLPARATASRGVEALREGAARARSLRECEVALMLLVIGPRACRHRQAHTVHVSTVIGCLQRAGPAPGLPTRRSVARSWRFGDGVRDGGTQVGKRGSNQIMRDEYNRNSQTIYTQSNARRTRTPDSGSRVRTFLYRERLTSRVT